MSSRKAAFLAVLLCAISTLCLAAYTGDARFAAESINIQTYQSGSTWQGWSTFAVNGGASSEKYFILCGTNYSAAEQTFAPWGTANPPEQSITLSSGGGYSTYIAVVNGSHKTGSFDTYLIEDDDQDGVLDPEDGTVDSLQCNVL